MRAPNDTTARAAGRPVNGPASARDHAGRDLYAEVTARIVAALEAGITPWAPRYDRAAAAALVLPRNGASGRAYSGVNVLLLWLTALERGYTSPAWYTFHQARQAGACVRRGERGTLVTLWREVVGRDRETGEEKRVPLLRHFTVFNRAQVDGLTDEPAGPRGVVTRSTWERVRAAEALVARHDVAVREGAPTPAYVPTLDLITMPAAAAYPAAADYYGSLTHELAHWTGHPARLARGAFTGEDGAVTCPEWDTPAYAREELVAELASAFLCAALALPAQEPRHASYLAMYLPLLSGDSRAIFRVAADARRAAEYLMGAAAPSFGDGDEAADEAGGAD